MQTDRSKCCVPQHSLVMLGFQFAMPGMDSDDDVPVGAKALENQAVDGLLKAFELATQEVTCKFSCGGSVDLSEPVKLLLKSTDNKGWLDTALTFPGMTALSALDLTRNYN